MGIFEALDEITDPERGGVAVSPDEVCLESLRALMNIRRVYEARIETLGKRYSMWVLDCDRWPRAGSAGS